MKADKKKIRVKQSDAVSRPIDNTPDRAVVSRIEDISVKDLREIMEKSIMSSVELLQKKIEELPFIMKPWLKPGTLTLLYGNAGIGKTLCCLSIAIAVTRKLRIGKWDVESPVGCLYLDGEMAISDMQARVEMLTKDLPPERKPLKFLTSEEMYREKNMVLNIANKRWRDGISDMLRNNPDIGLVVLDNISSLAPHLNENLKMDWDAVNQWLISLRFLGVAVIAVHHASMKGNPRGTSGRLDNIDCSIMLKPIDGSSKDQRACFEVRFMKKRSFYGIDAAPFCLTIEKDLDSGLPWTTSNSIGQNRRPYIVGLIGVGMKQRDIAEVLGCTEANVSQIKKKATKEGLFSEAGDPTEKWLEMYKGDTAEDMINEFKGN